MASAQKAVGPGRGEPAGARGAEAPPPRLLEQQVLGVARMAVIALNGHGRISQWSQVADELFGVGRVQALGRSLTALLSLPPEHRGVFEPEAFGAVWCGTCAVPRVDNGQHAEVAWWVYPIERPGGDATECGAPGAPGIRVLALAADLRRLRDEGLGLGLGDVLVVPPGRDRREAAPAARVLRADPALVRMAGPDAAPLGRRLAEMLPLTGPVAAEQVTARVLELGYPALNLSLTVRLPIVPYWGGMPRALRLKPRVTRVPVPAPAPPQPDAGAAKGVYATRRSPEGSCTSPGPPRQESEAKAVPDRFTFLGEAGQQIGSSLDHLQAARTLAEVLVPRLGDFAEVELLEQVASADWEQPSRTVGETTLMRRIAVVHDDEPGRWDDAVPEGELLYLAERTPPVQAMRTGRGVHIPRIGRERAEELSASHGDRDLRPLLAGRAMLIMPLIARGQVLGTFRLLRRSDRPGFDEPDLALIEELARHAALCIDNGRLYRREAQTAQELQRSMLPTVPPEIAGARVCFRYRPAGQTAQVGGDWFDAIPLPGSRLGIIVGDVMGHGVTSAAIMGQFRTAVRTLAAQDLRPDRLLRQLDGLAQRLGEGYLATCLYAVYDPVERRFRFANAGHIPPVLVSPSGESRVLPAPSGVPIGVGGEPFETVEVQVEDGSRLVLCTDGLLERRDRDIDEGLEELRAHLAGSTQPLESTCDAVLDALTTAVPADDVALVAVGLDGIAAGDVAVWNLDAEASMVPRARAQVADRLAEWRLADLTDSVLLMVSELVTNALVHGAGAIGMRLIKGSALLCEVYDDGHELPRLCHADATDESGRGLQLVSHLAERWGTNRTEHGKVVWFEHPLAG
ncbi:ATP-binding SpoIIE family protein phosphatase [Spirillospora sp. NBC_01491]|uniref:ATP-binding SpoIIE family protein phosphatase n=1 Tax=Spirillospora sp. NBC_01491 TaxID=2976007 RepID=UPI002E2FA0DD|nr:SpoIIE family protein phosphatase [Spirillospora sp. NBC_01491]